MAILQNSYIPRLPYAVFMSFGQRIKNRRGDLRLTGEDLGGRLSPPVSKQTIAHWEADRYRPHIDQVAQLCLVLKVSADELVLGEANALSPRAVEIARLFDSLLDTDQSRMELMIEAMGLGASETSLVNSDRDGKAPTKVVIAEPTMEALSKTKRAHLGLREFQVTGKGLNDETGKAGRVSKQRSNKRA